MPASKSLALLVSTGLLVVILTIVTLVLPGSALADAESDRNLDDVIAPILNEEVGLDARLAQEPGDGESVGSRSSHPSDRTPSDGADLALAVERAPNDAPAKPVSTKLRRARCGKRFCGYEIYWGFYDDAFLNIGLKPGDIIVSVDGRRLSSAKTAPAIFEIVLKGKAKRLGVIRGDRLFFVDAHW
ncbi:MAG: hypothetical protein AAGG11_23175 [Pseudomonadota bacterium]